MKKEDKKQLIENIGTELQKYPYIYVVDLEGLNSVDTAKLRRLCFKKEVKLLVVKNALLKKAMESMDKDFSEIYPTFKGQTSLMLSNVNNTPAKLIKEFRDKKEKPILKSAYVEEEFYIGDRCLTELTTIKSKNELIAEVMSALMSPAKNIIGALQSGGNTISGVLQTLSEKSE
ncbi:MAG: 50S ribosomal protein L10 [Bacteroidales bacterium]|jgi:large subunit ribosomal protein L10|nr:50S ribosomal protein L10 [Bacteroidales bacterium]